MTTAIVITTPFEDAFRMQHGIPDPEEGRFTADMGEPAPRYSHMHISGGMPLSVWRVQDGPRAYALNGGPKTVQVSYLIPHRTTGVVAVGPASDYIAPGQFKEIGAAPERVLWVFSEV